VDEETEIVDEEEEAEEEAAPVPELYENGAENDKEEDDNEDEDEDEDGDEGGNEEFKLSFPPGCSFQCYLDNNPDLKKKYPGGNEMTMLGHYLSVGIATGLDCTCHNDEDGTVGAAKDDDEEDGDNYEDYVFREENDDDDLEEEIEKVDEQIEKLEGQDDNVSEVEEEDLLELEEELIEEEMDKEGELYDYDDELDAPLTVELEHEIEEIEESIEVLENVNDAGDGTFAETKNEELEYLTNEKQKAEEELIEKLNELGMDPSLTMDLTTLNPPNLSSSEEPAEGELAGTTKEAESPPFNIDTEPDRTSSSANTSVAVLAEKTEEEESGSETIDAEEKETENGDGSDETAESETPSGEEDDGDEPGEIDEETDEETGNDGDEGDDSALTTEENETETSPSTPPPKETNEDEEEVTSAPTQGPNSASTTESPSVAYVEPEDESLDPVANESTSGDEAFQDGEVIATPIQDDDNGDWSDANAGESSSSSSTAEEWEEEEVKKVGGWLSVTSIILMIYTAYQMSENPDGICASLCRLVITVIGCMIKIALIPLKYIMGGGRPSGGHYMATPDYRDPYGSRHMELT